MVDILEAVLECKPKSRAIKRESLSLQTKIRRAVNEIDSRLSVTGHVISIENTEARSDASHRRRAVRIDLDGFWLPPNTVYPSPQRLTKQPDLAMMLARASAQCFQGKRVTTENLKNVRADAKRLAKIIEWCWLNGHYEPSSLTREDWVELVHDYSTDLWAGALDVESRIDNWLNNSERCDKELQQLNSRWGGIAKDSLCSLVGTNVDIKELSPSTIRLIESFLHAGNTKPGRENREKRDQGAGIGAVSTLMRTVNLLYYNRTFLPFPDVGKSARRLSQHRPGRTPNIKIEEATKLLLAPLKFVDDYSSKVIALYQQQWLELSLWLKGRSHLKDSANTNSYSFFMNQTLRKYVAANLQDDELLSRLGSVSSTTHLREDQLSLSEVRDMLFTACAVIVGSMNFRRKNEIIGDRHGVHKGCIEVIDAQRGLYNATFYVEKTIRDYCVFPTNRSTAKVIASLEHLYGFSEQLLTDDSVKTERTLFRSKNISPIALRQTVLRPYKYGTDKVSNSHEFMRYVFGGDSQCGEISRSHAMWRRLPFLLYFYRFEHSDLKSLKRQLAHLDIQMTKTYVTDAAAIDDAKRISQTIGQRNYDGGIDMEIETIVKDLETVRREKLNEDVVRILSGESIGGGYSQYIAMLIKRISSHVEFDRRDIDEWTKLVVKELNFRKRGSGLSVFEHGECHLNAERSKNAACTDANGYPQREQASANVCGSCPWHSTSDGYLENLDEQILVLKEREENYHLTPFENAHAKRERENLEHALILQRHRMQRNSMHIKKLMKTMMDTD